MLTCIVIEKTKKKHKNRKKLHIVNILDHVFKATLTYAKKKKSLQLNGK